MARPMGESKDRVLRLYFDRRLKLEFHGSKVTSDAGLLPYRELDDAVGLTEIAGDVVTDTRRGKNGRHGLVGQFRQSVFGRLSGYDDVNDADRLSLPDSSIFVGWQCPEAHPTNFVVIHTHPSRRFYLAVKFLGLHRNGSSSQFIDTPQDFSKQVPGHGDFGQLEPPIARNADA